MTTEADTVVSEATYKIHDTGQNLSYDNDGVAINPSEGEALYGQDAQYSSGYDFSFTDNGDGTITDNVTGLVWQQIPVSENMSWEEAIEYCENLELGGYDDWRIPTAKELFNISDFETGWPFLDTDYFEFPEASAAPEGADSSPQGSSSEGDAPQGDAPAGGPQDGAPQGDAPAGGPQDGGAPEGSDMKQAQH